MRGVNSDTLDTISAAATAIASSENRVPQASVQKRRWRIRWSMYWCFGAQKQTKRIGHAVFLPETISTGTGVSASQRPTQAPSIVLPFIAPPSSPASSFIQSEPPSSSCTQSPAGSLSFTSLSSCTYSPGPASIFAIGPYAHETQLVSPPVFSTYTTEPSTAPFTPPELVQFTTPSSPEVPFARLFDPNHQNDEASQRFAFSQYEFQSNHHYPDSPVIHLISPSSGTSSPFPIGDPPPPPPPPPPKLTALEWGSWQGSGSLTPDAAGPKPCDSFHPGLQASYVPQLPKSFNPCQNDEEVLRCMTKEEQYMAMALSPFVEITEADAEKNEKSTEVPNNHEDGHAPQEHRSITLCSPKEFNFKNPEGGVDSDKPAAIGSEWWSNEEEEEEEEDGSMNWSFFPMIQPGVS